MIDARVYKQLERAASCERDQIVCAVLMALENEPFRMRPAVLVDEKRFDAIAVHHAAFAVLPRTSVRTNKILFGRP